MTAAVLAAVVVTPVALAQSARETLSERVARLEQQLSSQGDAETRRTLTDLVLKLDDLQREVQQLRGMVEDQSFELEQIKRQQADQYLDLDRRLGELDGPSQVPVTNVGRPLNGDPSAPVTDVDPDPRANLQRPEVRESIDAGIATTGLGEDPNLDIAPVVDPAAEKAAYDVAFEALKEGRYAESARRFADFLEGYPDGEYADNAQYWLAESYYVTGNYRIALDAFQQLISRFPQSSKVQDATLKLAFTYYELKQWEAAERTLNEVVSRYPDTTVSRLAENRLRTMRIEGHIR